MIDPPTDANEPRPYALEEPPPDEALAPERPPAPALAPHRVALRAAVTAPLAGFAAAFTALVVFALGDSVPNAELVAGIITLGTLAVAAWTALLVISEEVARRVPLPALRAPTIALVGAGAALFAGAAVVWALAMYQGKGADGALEELAQLIDSLRRRPDNTAQVALITLLPFLAFGAPRVHAGWARHPLAGAGLGLAGGLLAFLATCAFEGRWPGQRERVLVVGMFLLVPAACGLGLGLGEKLEAALLARWARWRDRDRDG